MAESVYYSGYPLDYAEQTDEQAIGNYTPDYLIASRNRLAKAYANLGNTLYNQQEFDQALVHFRAILNDVPDLPPAELARVYCNIGLATSKKGDLDQALASFQTALDLDANLAQARFHVERIKYEQQNLQKGYQFFQDEFTRKIPVLRKHLQKFVGQSELSLLEVGSGDGRSTCWLIENLLTDTTAQLTCVNNGSDANRIAMFESNLDKTGSASQVIKHVGHPELILRSLPLNTYDFIYIQGCSLAPELLTQAVLTWDLLKPKGLLCLDDDETGERSPKPMSKDALKQHARLGAEAFLASFFYRFHLLRKGNPVLVEKSE
jgi:tetratricopeptide (TPR) repeat protein